MLAEAATQGDEVSVVGRSPWHIVVHVSVGLRCKRGGAMMMKKGNQKLESGIDSGYITFYSTWVKPQSVS